MQCDFGALNKLIPLNSISTKKGTCIERDWGWAPEYVYAMRLMLQQDSIDDFVIATWKANSLRKFIKLPFEYLGLVTENHLFIKEELFRPTDLKINMVDPSMAKDILKWQAKTDLEDIIKYIIHNELR